MNTSESEKTKKDLTRPAIYVVATPIGNLEDITLRAIRVLSDCDLIASEDTRVTLKLLSHLNIKNKKLESYHDKIEEKKAATLLDRLEQENLALALVSDAGTPLISDPGFHLIKQAHSRDIPVIPVPGASSLTALVSASGLPNTKIHFTGFLPKKEGLKKEEIQSWKKLKSSIVFFETAPRLSKTLEQIAKYHPEALLCLGRELTKLHESISTHPIASFLEKLEKGEIPLKGECALMISFPFESKELSQEEKKSLALKVLAEYPHASTKECAQILKEEGLSSKEAYELIIKSKA